MGITGFFRLILKNIVRFFKFILVIIECITFFIAIFVIHNSINHAGLSEITLMVSAFLFPLMAVFIWLDSTRYRVYIPLFTSGKFIGLFSLLGFPIITGQDSKYSKFGIFSEDASFVTLLLVSYLFSLLVVFFIIFIGKKTGGENQNVEKNEEKKAEVV
jgi:hypothetical protein